MVYAGNLTGISSCSPWSPRGSLRSLVTHYGSDISLRKKILACAVPSDCKMDGVCEPTLRRLPIQFRKNFRIVFEVGR